MTTAHAGFSLSSDIVPFWDNSFEGFCNAIQRFIRMLDVSDLK